MITLHRHCTIAHHRRNNLQAGFRVSAITQQITQKYILLRSLPACMRKAGLQRLQVAVYIGQDSCFHVGIIIP